MSLFSYGPDVVLGLAGSMRGREGLGRSRGPPRPQPIDRLRYIPRQQLFVLAPWLQEQRDRLVGAIERLHRDAVALVKLMLPDVA